MRPTLSTLSRTLAWLVAVVPALSAASNHFLIYYRDGRVPQPGIIMLGRVTGDVSIFDRPGAVSIRVERTK